MLPVELSPLPYARWLVAEFFIHTSMSECGARGRKLNEVEEGACHDLVGLKRFQ